jgi:hypothetical protein
VTPCQLKPLLDFHPRSAIAGVPRGHTAARGVASGLAVVVAVAYKGQGSGQWHVSIGMCARGWVFRQVTRVLLRMPNHRWRLCSLELISRTTAYSLSQITIETAEIS